MTAFIDGVQATAQGCVRHWSYCCVVVLDKAVGKAALSMENDKRNLSRNLKSAIGSTCWANNAPNLDTTHRTAPHRTAPHRTAPHRTAPHRTATQPTVPHNTRHATQHNVSPHNTRRCTCRHDANRTRLGAARCDSLRYDPTWSQAYPPQRKATHHGGGAMRCGSTRCDELNPSPIRPGPARPGPARRHATPRNATQRNATQRNATQKPSHLNVGHRQHVLGRAENLVAVPRKAILLGGVAQHSQSGATLSRAVVLSNTQARPRHDLLCTSRSTQNIVEAKVRMGGRLESG